MKGKKIDSCFISNFINDSCLKGKLTIAEIVSFAQEQISEIDQKIIEAENLKKLRSKLMDVVITFNYNKTLSCILDENLLNFYRVKDKQIAKKICSEIFTFSSLEEIKKNFPASEETFCIKQMLEYNILQRYNETIKAGENFPAFKIFLKDNYGFDR